MRPELTRARLLQEIAIVGATPALAGAAAACGSHWSDDTVGDVTAMAHRVGLHTPSKGGVLRISMIGKGGSETYSPTVVNVPVDFLHAYSGSRWMDDLNDFNVWGWGVA